MGSRPLIVLMWTWVDVKKEQLLMGFGGLAFGILASLDIMKTLQS